MCFLQRRFGGNVLAAESGLGDKPLMSDLIGVVKVMLDAYDEGEIDRLYLCITSLLTP